MNDDESQIIQTLHRFSYAYRTKDLATVVASFSRKGSPTVVFGSGSSEPLLEIDAITDALSREFAEWRDLQLTTRWANLHVAGDVAWISALTRAVSASLAEEMLGRFTAILIREGKAWRIAHLHFSFPTASANTGPIGEEPTKKSGHALLETSAYG